MDVFKYSTRVRKSGFIWGGPDIRQNLNANLILIIKIDEDGEQVSLGTFTAGATASTDLGKLSPGQVFAIPLDGLIAVVARSDHDVGVDCSVLSANQGTAKPV